MAKHKPSKERRCRKNIVAFLSLLGFHDDDPDTTIQLMFEKLDKIEEKKHALTAVRRSRIRKITTVKSHDAAASSMELSSFVRNIGGTNPRLVIEKRLTTTDVTRNQGRLLIPALKVTDSDFLTAVEKERLGKKQDVSVLVYDPEQRKSTLNLAQWKMKNENYVLKTGWNELVSTNGLEEDMVIRVWSFRVEQQLCFSIVHAI